MLNEFFLEQPRLDILPDVRALFKRALMTFEGRQDTEVTRQEMYDAARGIAQAAIARGLLAKGPLNGGTAIIFPVTHSGVAPDTEMVFEMSEEHVLRVWLRHTGDASWRIIRRLYPT